MCEPCSTINTSPQSMLAMILLAVTMVGLLCACRRRVSPQRPTSAPLQMQLTEDNPLQTGLGPARASMSSLQSTVQRSDDVYMLMRVLYQPIRILVGYGQVVNQIGVVLEIEFPPLIRQTFDLLSLLAINLKSILHIDCLSDLSFCMCLPLLDPIVA